LIQALSCLKRYPEALEVSEDAKRKGLECLQVSFETCTALLGAGLLSQAESEAEAMMGYKWIEGQAGDGGIDTHKKYVVYAQILLARGKAEKALKQCKIALKAAPEYAPGMFVLGQVLEALSRFEESRMSFEKALGDPLCRRPAILGLHRVLMGENKVAEAAKAVEKGWMDDPSDTKLWLLWKSTLERLGDVKGMLHAYRSFASRHQVTSDFLIEWGRLAMSAGENPEAIASFAEAMRVDPKCANAYFNCADLLCQLGSFPEAVRIYQAGLSLSPDYAEGWFMLGNALAKSGRVEEAQTAYLIVLEKNPEHAGAIHNLDVLQAA
jgi:tetratricopeptide (TPR) repeat protein